MRYGVLTFSYRRYNLAIKHKWLFLRHLSEYSFEKLWNVIYTKSKHIRKMMVTVLWITLIVSSIRLFTNTKNSTFILFTVMWRNLIQISTLNSVRWRRMRYLCLVSAIWNIYNKKQALFTSNTNINFIEFEMVKR